jgi:hypothetical protein
VGSLLKGLGVSVARIAYRVLVRSYPNKLR